MELSGAALKPAAAFAGGAAVLNFVAHQDDDLLILSPDLLHAIRAGGNVRTVYLTAGDAGLHASYWQDRESGARAAYAEMAGAANSWTQSDAGVAGHPIPVFTLTGQRNVSLVFLRLPDGNFSGSGADWHGGGCVGPEDSLPGQYCPPPTYLARRTYRAGAVTSVSGVAFRAWSGSRWNRWTAST